MNEMASRSTAKAKGDLVEDVVALLFEDKSLRVSKRVHLPVLKSTGRTREIDVLVESQVAGVPIRIAVECKNYGTPIGVDLIGEFKDKLDEVGIPPQLGIYVAATGYTSDALDRARSVGMRALVIQGLTPDRMGAEVLFASQSIVNLLLTVTNVTYRTSNPEGLNGLFLRIMDRTGQLTGYLADVVWAKWRDGALQSELGKHDFVPKLPRRWKFIDDSGVEPSYVKLEYQVLGLVMQISGTANRLSLTDPTTGQDERVQINATFAGKTRTYPVTQYLTEAELREASKAVSSEILKITHGRNRLPRIQTDKIYWPPSDRAMRFISESIHTQVRQGTFEWSSIHGLTFEQVEGTDLSRISDPIAHDHQAAYDPTWSPTRHRKPSLKPRTH